MKEVYDIREARRVIEILRRREIILLSALRRLLKAEKTFVEDSGIPLTDGVSESVEYAEQILRGLEPVPEPDPWDWIPHTDGLDRANEINDFLRNAVNSARLATKT